jgi:hypothetical protein
MKKGIGFAIVALALVFGGCGKKTEETKASSDSLGSAKPDPKKDTVRININATTTVMPGAVAGDPIQVILGPNGNQALVFIYNLDPDNNHISFEWPQGTQHNLQPQHNDEWDIYTLPPAGAAPYSAYVTITNNSVTHLYHAPYGNNALKNTYSFTGVYADDDFVTYAIIEVGDYNLFKTP